MALPAPAQPPALAGGGAPWSGCGPGPRGGEGRAQVAGPPPGCERGRGAAVAGWGGSGPAASSCSPPAWGSAGRSEVRAQLPFPVPSPAAPRLPAQGGGPLGTPGGPGKPRGDPYSSSGAGRSWAGRRGGDCSAPRGGVGAAAGNFQPPPPPPHTPARGPPRQFRGAQGRPGVRARGGGPSRASQGPRCRAGVSELDSGVHSQQSERILPPSLLSLCSSAPGPGQ